MRFPDSRLTVTWLCHSFTQHTQYTGNEYPQKKTIQRKAEKEAITRAQAAKGCLWYAIAMYIPSYYARILIYQLYLGSETRIYRPTVVDPTQNFVPRQRLDRESDPAVSGKPMKQFVPAQTSAGTSR